MTWGWRWACMPCFCLFLWLIAFTLSHRLSTVIQCALCNCGCQCPSSNRSTSQDLGRAERDMPVCLTLELRRDENCLCVLHLPVSVTDSLPSCQNRSNTTWVFLCDGGSHQPRSNRSVLQIGGARYLSLFCILALSNNAFPWPHSLCVLPLCLEWT